MNETEVTSVEFELSDFSDMLGYANNTTDQVEAATPIPEVLIEPAMSPAEELVEQMLPTTEEVQEYDMPEQEVIEETPVVEPATLPVNSDTIKINEFTSRFNSAVWAEKARDMEVILAGCGGIGSWTGFILSRLGIKTLVLYDDDVVDSSNISGQLYKIADKNQYKVAALRRMIIDYTGMYNVTSINQKYTHSSSSHKIMICGFDNMSARKTFFTKWYERLQSDSKRSDFNPKEYIFIDGRLAAEELQVFCLTGDNTHFIKEYNDKYLFSDEEAEPTVCSYKQTTFMSNMIASIISNIFVNYITNLCDGVILDREIPFLTTYQADYMLFNVVR